VSGPCSRSSDVGDVCSWTGRAGAGVVGTHRKQSAAIGVRMLARKY
jgi:hypothetical protein